jgi:hypothetical protein
MGKGTPSHREIYCHTVVFTLTATKSYNCLYKTCCCNGNSRGRGRGWEVGIEVKYWGPNWGCCGEIDTHKWNVFLSPGDDMYTRARFWNDQNLLNRANSMRTESCDELERLRNRWKELNYSLFPRGKINRDLHEARYSSLRFSALTSCKSRRILFRINDLQ